MAAFAGRSECLLSDCSFDRSRSKLDLFAELCGPRVSDAD